MEGSDYRELRMLSEVHSTPGTTQRDLSRQIGIALGLTNVLLRNLVEKGYVRITQASWKRWMYALTPSGFSRKIQLTVAYVHRVLDHYQEVRQTLREELQTVHLNEESRVAIFGTGEFAELVYLGLRRWRSRR
jgi:DNA-binding MarR family transcriptional regulator